MPKEPFVIENEIMGTARSTTGFKKMNLSDYRQRIA
jgi:hypothetical protein